MPFESELSEAIRRRQELVQELEKIEQLINLLGWWRDEAIARPAKTQAGPPTHRPFDLAHDQQLPKPESPPEPFATPAEVIRETLIVLSEHGRPLKRGQLLKELADNGVRIRGGDKSKVLGTTLWRAKDKIISIDGWGYWIKDRPSPLAGYKPERDPIDDLLG